MSAIRRNIEFIRSKTKADICAVVKSDAYGHGLTQISSFIQPFVDEFAVATYFEAQELVGCGIKKPINILGNIDKSCLEPYNLNNVFPTVACLDDITYLLTQNFFGSVNVKINSGMNRLGAKNDDINIIVGALKNSKIAIKSMFTHFYNSSDINCVNNQFAIFAKVIKNFSYETNQFHICASNCLTLPPSYHLSMVRTGLAMYGYGDANLSPAMTVKTNILQIIKVNKGENIGYGSFKAPKSCIIAAIRAGYGDGYRRIANNNRYVCICGQLCKIIGQVCMDICMVDVSDVGVSIDTPVYLVNNIATVDRLAKSYSTINYEVLTSFGDRAKRVYVK